jgi:ankyrin repeat protein
MKYFFITIFFILFCFYIFGDNETLSSAASDGDVQEIKRLLEAGVNANTDDGGEALKIAAEYGHIDIVRLLVEAGADVNIADSDYGFTPLIRAIRGLEHKIFWLGIGMLEDGMENTDVYEEEYNIAKSRYIEIIKLLIEAGADVNAQGSYCGDSVLMYAITFPDIVRILIDYGAEVNIQNEYGDTALKKAIFLRKEMIIEMLIQAGANIKVQSVK